MELPVIQQVQHYKGAVVIKLGSSFKASDVLAMDATTLAGYIQNKYIRSAEAVQIFIQHLKSINPDINCVVEERFSEALFEAEECDRLLDAGDAVGRLFGVPISVKEALDVCGMKTTGGLRHRQHHIASEDSEAVVRLRQDGAIVLCKTNTPTACLTFESANKLHGRTNNPRRTTRTAGGSSGGEAALIAAGGAAAGIGSDLAGSLRLPGHFNGVISFKTGEGDVSLEGHFPKPVHKQQRDMLGLGPITKTVADSELMYHIMTDADVESIDPSGCRLIMPPIPEKYPMSADTTHAYNIVRDLFADTVLEQKLPDFVWKLPLMHLKFLMINGARDMYPMLFNTEHFPVFRTLIKEKTQGDTDYDYPFLKTMLLARLGFMVSQTKAGSKRLKKLTDEVQKWKKQMDRMLEKSVLILPVYPEPADRHDEVAKTLLSNRFLFRKWIPFTILPNVLGLPSLSIPISKDQYQLPISVQLISKKGNEQSLFHYGRKLEQHFLGYERAELQG